MAETPADKPATLEDLARAEAREVAKREENARLYTAGQTRLRSEMPARFFTFARQLREGVARYNGAAKLEHPLEYSETAAVATRDTNHEGDFYVEVKRKPNSVGVALRNMHRIRGQDTFVIEGSGEAGPPSAQDKFRLRVEGVFKGTELIWRINCDGRLVDTPLDELADRLIAVVATGELTRVWTMAPFVERKK